MSSSFDKAALSLTEDQGDQFWTWLIEIQEATQSLRVAVKSFPLPSLGADQMDASITVEAFTEAIDRRAEKLLEMYNANRHEGGK